ncbi:hypothetical protein MMC13_007225 [Lambiella insularis]|nr:hypothetical protein [Lambiella insularis]
MAVSQANGVAGFVRRNGNGADDPSVHTLQKRHQPADVPHLNPFVDGFQDVKPSTSSSIRDSIGNLARIKLKPTKLEHSIQPPEMIVAKSASRAEDSVGGDMRVLSHVYTEVPVKQEYLHHSSKVGDMWDTDAESFDDTTATNPRTFNNDGQTEGNSRPESVPQHMAPESLYEADVARMNNPLYESTHVDSHDIYPVESHSLAEGDDAFEEDETTESGASDEEAFEEVVPTLNRIGIRAFLHPGETQEFQDFQKQRRRHNPALANRGIPTVSMYAEGFQAQSGSQAHYIEQIDEMNRSASRPASRSAAHSEREKVESSGWIEGRKLTQLQNVRRQINLPQHSKKRNPTDSSDLISKMPLDIEFPATQEDSKNESLAVLKSSRIDSSIGYNLTPSKPSGTNSQHAAPVQVALSNGEHQPEEQRQNVQQLAHLLPILPQSGRKRIAELDYSDEQLAKMPFNQLKFESFDHDPHGSPFVLPANISSQPISQQIAYISDLKSIAEGSRSEQQRAFFSSLTIEKYEEWGDLILGRFADILTKFKNARQEKRRIAKGFEEEVSVREERIRGRSQLIDQKLAKLREAGEGVIRGQGT